MSGAVKLRISGVVVGGALAFTTAHSPLAPLAVPAFVIFVLGAVALSELMSPRPSRSTEPTARLTARDADAYLPPHARRNLRWLYPLAGLTMSAVALVLNQSLGFLDERTGTDLLVLLVPAAAMLFGWGLLANHLLRRIADAGHAGVRPQQLAADEAWRRRAAHLVYGTTGTLLSGVITGALFLVGEQFWLGHYGSWGLIAFLVALPTMGALFVLAHFLRLLTDPGPLGEVTVPAGRERVEAAV